MNKHLAYPLLKSLLTNKHIKTATAKYIISILHIVVISIVISVAGLGTNPKDTEGKLAIWSNARLIAKSVDEIIGEIDNYYNWSAVLQSSTYFCAENEKGWFQNARPVAEICRKNRSVP